MAEEKDDTSKNKEDIEQAKPMKRKILRVAVGTVNPAKLRAVDQALRRAAAAWASRMRTTVSMTTAAIVTNDNADEDNDTDLVDFEISGFDVDSRVSDQPFGDKETLRGAKNRAQAAYQAYRNANQRTPHLAVGMEGGLEWLDHHYEDDGGTGEKQQRKDLGIGNNDNDRTNDDNTTTKNSTQKLYCMAWMAIFGRREAITVELFATAALESYCADNAPVFGLAKTSMFPIPDAVAALVRQGIELGEADDMVFNRVQSKHGNGLVGLLTGGIVDRSEYYEQALVLALSPWMRSDLYPYGNY